METNNQKACHFIRECFHARPVLVFSVLAFLLSWLCWGVVFLANGLEAPVWPVVTGLFTILVGFGPFLAATIVVKGNGGSVRQWLRQIFRWKVKWYWYLAAFVVPVLLIEASGALYSFLGGEVAEAGFDLNLLVMLIPLFLWNTLLGGGQEELGWRGFALPKLQEKYPALTASLVLGFIHALWHLPMFFLLGTYQANTSLLHYTLSVIGIAVVCTWIYNNTGSIVPVMIYHGMTNTIPLFSLLPSFDPATMVIPEMPTLLTTVYVLVSLVVAVVISLLFGTKRLTRKAEFPTISF
ncbi:MAG: CPBP family intramembrane metalloprotease [Firmicutes bacterium]|nr:CPBP family intramembrane metalloprotease [Bacillota bacterium]